jgi:hypothetical protein
MTSRFRWQWEVRGFSLFAGPDMLADLHVGMELEVVPRGTWRRKGLVFARGRQIGYLEDGNSDVIPARVTLSAMTREANGKHRVWVSFPGARVML